MNSTMAKLSALLSAFLIAAAVGVLWVTSHPGPGATQVKAEFEDAFPILAGMNVRVSGAVAGSVREVEVTDNGTAMVTLSLNEGTEAPHSDAAASIRQQDITGDSYVSLSPGAAPDELGDEAIPVDRTLVAPRFDDLLNSFGEEERLALRLVLVEAGKALERRGEDLNRAALELRPALGAANQAVAELSSQNDALRSLVADAERTTGPAAGRSKELGGLVDSLAATLDATADHAPALDRAVEGLPATAQRAKVTLTKLRKTAVATKPLANLLEEGAPQLSRSLGELGPFLGDARSSLKDLRPTFRQTNELLDQARPTLLAAPDKILTAPFELAGSVDDLLRTLLGNEDVFKTLFGADAYGQPPGNADDIGLGAIAVETGAQDGYEGTDPARSFQRAVVVPSCEIFGLPIEPGCLPNALDLFANQRGKRKKGAPQLAAPGLEAPGSPSIPPLLPDAAGSPPQVPGAPPSAPPPSGGPLLSPDGISSLLNFLLGGSQ